MKSLRLVVVAFGSVSTAILFMAISWNSSQAALVTRTWDGGGATNNWSDAANWSGDVVPTENDDAVFDGTSTKNALIDTTTSVRSLNIAAGYTGTISQSGSATFSIINGASSMAGGTFTCGGTVIFNNLTFNLSAGSFNCANGTFNGINFLNLVISGGTFTAPNGTMTLVSGSSTIETGAAGTFISSGTIVATGDFLTFRIINGTAATLDLNNLTINLANPGGTIGPNEPADKLRILGTLTLTRGDTQGTLEAHGPVAIADTWGTGNQSGKLVLAGNATRTVTLPTLAPAMSYVHLEINAPNTTVNTSGSGPVKLKSIALGSGVLNTGSIPFSLGTGDSFRTSTIAGGTFICGGLVTLNAVELIQQAGVFNCVSGTIDSNFVVIRINGGVFEAPSGTMTLRSPTGSVLDFGPSGTFDANNGTLSFTGASAQITIAAAPSTIQFGNLTVDLSGNLFLPNGLTLSVKDFNQQSGTIFQGNLNVSGNMSVGSGVPSNGNSANIKFTGGNQQTYANSGGANLQGDWIIDKPAGTLTLQSSLDLTNGFGVFNLNQGTITTGTNVVDLGTRNVVRTNGRVIGNLKRRFTVTGIKTFDVGTTNGYAPVSINVSALGTNPSDLTVGNTQGTHPVLPPNISLGRYWSITESGNVTANLTFNYLQSDVNGNENNYKVNRIVGSQVEVLQPPTATVDTAANTATVNGVTEFSDWTLSGAGPPLVLTPLNPTIGAGFSQQFNATGGVPPYTFSISTNNSGANINTATGFYVAGGTFGVQDTVQVTDSNSSSVSTNVTVIDPFLVVNTNDSGVGSLRQTVINANNAPGQQIIRFNIPGTPPFSIAPLTPLPKMTQSTTIDGTSQPGYAGAPVIELDGSNYVGNAPALEIENGNSSLIQGLAINRFSGVQAIVVSTSNQVRIRSNYIGVGLDGVTPRANGLGVLLNGVNDSVIGGFNIQDRNVISANAFDGLAITGASINNKIYLNYIGVGADGTSPAGNGRSGITISGGTANEIGGTGVQNVVAYTGTISPPPVVRGGIVVNGSASGVEIRANSIHSNVGLGIDLGVSDVTPNDNCDADTGANGLQNFPVLQSASSSSGTTTIQGDLDSTPNTSFVLNFYSNLTVDPSGNGEGRTFIGTTNVSTGSGCIVPFQVTIPGVSLPSGVFVTATASTANGTSEFSNAVTAGCNYSISPTAQNFNSNGGNGSFTVNSDAGCAWTAVASDSFISIVSTPSGNGTGTVNFTVSANTTGSPRSGTITVAGRTFTITQGAVCAFELNPNSQNFDAAGGTGTINVQTPAGCPWTAVSNNQFITVTSGGSGNGPGTVGYSVTAFTGGFRQGTITVGDRTFTVSQSSAIAGCGGNSFRVTTSQLGELSSAMVTANDFNRDGLPDLLYFTNVTPARLLVLGGNGDGTFSPLPSTPFPDISSIVGVATADFNRDGLIDVAVNVSVASSQRELRVLLGNGSGGFGVSAVLPVSGGGNFLAGDFNGDGKPDLVSGAAVLHNQFFAGNGNGTFAPVADRSGGIGSNVKSADINNDSKLDFVSSQFFTLDISLGAGDGSFSVASSVIAKHGFRQLELGDVNRDGKIDIIATDVGPQPPTTTIRVFLGNGSGGFAAGISLPPMNGVVDLALVDLNRDAKPDIVASGGGAGVLNIYHGNGTGSFTLAQTFTLPVSNQVVLADFNVDGKADFAAMLVNGHTGIFLNACGGLTQKPKIDFDGDGKTDIAIFRPATGEWYVLRSSDGSYFSFVFGLSGDIPSAADFDGDNKTDAAVFRPSVGAWFVLRSSDGGATIVAFGAAGDRPAAGDYDGDGKADFAIFRPGTGEWWVRRSSDNQVVVFQWGVGSDVIVQ